MPKLAVTSSRPDQVPAVLLDPLDHVSNLHPTGDVARPGSGLYPTFRQTGLSDSEGQTSSSAESFPITSAIASLGRRAASSARRTRQSRLLTWSASTTPATGKPAGRGTSKG